MTQKLNKEHFESITKLQQDFSAVLRELGSLTLDLEFLDAQKKAAEERKVSLINQFTQLRESEEQILEQLKTHYGEGQIDMQAGTFTPTSEGQVD